MLMSYRNSIGIRQSINRDDAHSLQMASEHGDHTLNQLARVSWLAVVTLFLVGNAMAIEEAEYTVLRNVDPFELRMYEAHIVAETTVDDEFEKAGNEAFRPLFSYISGNNRQQQKVAMTSPVSQEPASRKIAMTSPVGQQEKDGKWVVSFSMPASFSLETTPEPMDSNVVIRQVAPRYVAAVRYSGFWSEKNYRRNLLKLQDWIAESDLRAAGEPLWARYDPPFMPWFLRRNEILIPVEPPEPRD